MIKDKPIIDNIINTSIQTGVSEEEVENMIDLTYEFIRHKIVELDMRNMSLEEFKHSKKNFNIPGLMKLYADERVFKKMNKKDDNNL